MPSDLGERQASAVALDVLDRRFEDAAPNRKWIENFAYVWTGEGWLQVAAIVDLLVQPGANDCPMKTGGI